MIRATLNTNQSSTPGLAARSASIAAAALRELLLGVRPTAALVRVPLMLLLGGWLVAQGLWWVVLYVLAAWFAVLWWFAYHTIVLLERLAAREERRLRGVALTHPERVYGPAAVMRRHGEP